MTRPTAIFCLTLLSASALRAVTVDVTSYGAVPDSGQDATPAFQQAIAAAKAAAPPVTFNIPAGRYDFFATQATQRACYFSNATDPGSNAVRTIALDLTDLTGLVIEGNGARLVMRGKMTLLAAERCAGLTLRNLVFDFQRPTFSEITCTAKTSTTWTGQVHADSLYQITGGNRVLWTGEDWQIYHNLVQHYDPATRTVWRGGDPTASASSVTDLGGGQLRFTVPSGSLANVVVGRVYQFRDTARDQCGMWFNRSSDIVMQDVTVRAMHGFGILAQFTENVTYTRLAVTPDPASGRTCASPADILHFSNCRGQLRIHDCTLDAAHDDALNVHGTHLRIVTTTPAANQIKVRFMHSQSWGFQAFVPGDEIEFVHRDTLLPYATATVASVVMDNLTDQTLTLTQPLPSGIVTDSDAVENTTWTPAVEMLNCDISRIPTRGVLLTTRRPIVVRGNRFFRTQMPAILCEDDASGWYESGPVHDLTAASNSFYECGAPVVHLNPTNTTHAGPVHQNISLSGNVFTLASNTAVSARSTDNLALTGNRFRMVSNTNPSLSALVSATNTTHLNLAANNTVQPVRIPALTLANPGFEQAPPASGASPGRLTSWFSLPATALETGTPTGNRLLLTPNGAVWQEIGFTDPREGGVFKLRFHQVAIAGQSCGLTATLHAWDARHIPADDADIAAALPATRSHTFPSAAGSIDRAATFDLTHLSPGTRLWLRISAAGAASLDDFTFAAPQPAAITFADPVTCSADADVLTTGTLVAACSLHNGGGTVNGVTFTNGPGSAFTLSPTGNTYGSFGGGSANPYAGLSAAYRSLLANGRYGLSGTTLALNSLTPGRTYAVQLWTNDSRSPSSGGSGYSTARTIFTGTNTVQAKINSTAAAGGVGQFTIGTFTADAATISLTLTSTGYQYNDTYLNAIQLRDITTPYDAWALANALTAENKDPLLDPDGDGAANLTEFAFGGNPLSTAGLRGPAGAIRVIGGVDNLTLTLAARSGAVFAPEANNTMTAAMDGITYRIEGSTDLATWTDPIMETDPLTAGLPDLPAGYTWHSFRTGGPVSDVPRNFIRAKVSTP